MVWVQSLSRSASDPTRCSPPGPCAHGTQSKNTEWLPFTCKIFPDPENPEVSVLQEVSCIGSRFFTECFTQEACIQCCKKYISKYISVCTGFGKIPFLNLGGYRNYQQQDTEKCLEKTCLALCQLWISGQYKRPVLSLSLRISDKSLSSVCLFKYLLPWSLLSTYFLVQFFSFCAFSE